MRIVFMGTPDFSVAALDSLVGAGHEIVAVVTQPDKPKGRGKEVLMTPVKARALELGIPVYQPVRIKNDREFIDMLKSMAPDIMVVVAFGQILTQEILDIPRLGCVNIHASLLPMYRGAAPLQWVIINGETQSGVTTMQMDAGIDTGDMLLRETVAIEPKETYESIHDKLSIVGARLIVETLKGLEEGTIIPVKQEGESCYAKMIDKNLANVDWSSSAVYIERLIRGLNPAPCAFTHLEGKTLKLWDADVVSADFSTEDVVPGTIINITKKYFDVVTGNGVLRINELQLEGKKRMDTASFLRGYNLIEGTVLGQNKF